MDRGLGCVSESCAMDFSAHTIMWVGRLPLAVEVICGGLTHRRAHGESKCERDCCDHDGGASVLILKDTSTATGNVLYLYLPLALSEATAFLQHRLQYECANHSPEITVHGS